MNGSKVVQIIVVVVVVTLMFTAYFLFDYISVLNKQNSLILSSVNQIQARLDCLRLEEILQSLDELTAENTALKKQIECRRGTGKEDKGSVVKGNRGFLIRKGKSTQAAQ